MTRAAYILLRFAEMVISSNSRLYNAVIHSGSPTRRPAHGRTLTGRQTLNGRGVGTELTGSSHGMRLTQREKPWTVRARHLANRGGMTEMIRTWWPVAVTVIAAIAWLIRLEARSISNGAEIKRLWSQRREDMEAAKESRDRMDRRLDEIASDIKALLRGMEK